MASVKLLPATPIPPLKLAASDCVVCAGGNSDGRSASGTMTWTAAKMASVTAMAGSERRIRTPIATPRAKPNAA